MAKKARKRRPAPDKPASQTRNAYGIVGPYGNVWTTKVFDTPAEAEQHVAAFWNGIKHDLSKYRVVRARATVTYLGELQ